MYPFCLTTDKTRLGKFQISGVRSAARVNFQPNTPGRRSHHYSIRHALCDIPQDIIDTVLDELTHDTDTLKQCSTVSRSFFWPSCKHLFRSITLDNLKKDKRIQASLNIQA